MRKRGNMWLRRSVLAGALVVFLAAGVSACGTGRCRDRGRNRSRMRRMLERRLQKPEIRIRMRANPGMVLAVNCSRMVQDSLAVPCLHRSGAT